MCVWIRKNILITESFSFQIYLKLAIQWKFVFAKNRLIESKDRRYGTLDDDGNWNGMVGMVVNDVRDSFSFHILL